MHLFEQFMQLPLELHYHFLQLLPADRQVFAAAACATWYGLIHKQIRVNVYAVAMYGRVELLDWLQPGLRDTDVPAILHAAVRLDRADLVRWANTNFPGYTEPPTDQWCELHEYAIRALSWGHITALRELLVKYDHIRDVNCYVPLGSTNSGYAVLRLIDGLIADDAELLDIIIHGNEVRTHADGYIEHAICRGTAWVYEALTKLYDRYPLQMAVRLRKSKYIKYAIGMKPSVLDLIVITARKIDDRDTLEYMHALGYGDRTNAVLRTLAQLGR